jgi:nucleoside-diphosphate-sugar epimerase
MSLPNIFSNKKILVTGATGFIGHYVAKRLLGSGARVRVLARTPEKAKELQSLGAEIVHGDLLDQDCIAKVVQGCSWVFHFAGTLADELKPRKYFRRVNVTATKQLAEAALAAGVKRFVHASTIWVYGLEAKLGTDEKTNYQYSRAPYCDTKLDGENAIKALVKEKKLPAVIVQPSWVYGPRDEGWTLAPLRLMKKNMMIMPNAGRGLMIPIYIDDLVDGIIMVAIQGEIGEAYILCGDESVSLKDFFMRLAALLGKTHLPSIPTWLALGVARISEVFAKATGQQPVFTVEAIRGTLMQASYENTKAKHLGFTPQVTLEQGMKKVGQWLHKEGNGTLE